jgi:N-methylhydantoinase B/oxoprolinase/acetone carboxylase alpha subunit
MRIETPGGGGAGAPAGRNPERLDEDRSNGKAAN